MSKVLVLGGGFSGVVAAESMAKKLGPEHQITLISRNDRFVFYPALVRLAFGHAEPDDVSFDLRSAMLDRRVQFIEADVAHIDPISREVTVVGNEFEGTVSYDFVVCALGRRLATEQIPGFFEFSHHLLTVEAALKFGEAIKKFNSGRAVIGYCYGSRLAIPAYETAFALAKSLIDRGHKDQTRITVVGHETKSEQLGGAEVSRVLHDSLTANHIEFVPDFRISRVTAGAVQTTENQYLKYDLLMLVPPFEGTSAVQGTGLTDDDGYLYVDDFMRVHKTKHMYAVGDCVAFSGPKMGHMAVMQAKVAAENIVAEINGGVPDATYDHELKYVIDGGGKDSIFFHKNIWTGDDVKVRQGQFWGWAKRIQERHWEAEHS